MNTATLFVLLFVPGAGLAIHWAYRLGKASRPEQQAWDRVRADLTAQIARFNTEAEDRETRAYERGRIDQAEVESAKRSASALVGAATRRDRRVNRLTGETKPAFGAQPVCGVCHGYHASEDCPHSTVNPRATAPIADTGAPTDA